MVPDGMGFEYPVVDTDICTGCGVCEEACAFRAMRELGGGVPEAFAFRHKDPGEVAASQSGAAFIGISDTVLEDGGSVFGACLGEDFSVSHRGACDKAGRDKMRGSKYVQSSMDGCFDKVIKELREGRTVLFSGTPCQCAGLRHIVGPLGRRLVTMDIVCHGVPAPAVWKAYLETRASDEGSEVVGANFRDKSRYGWKNHRESITFANGKTIDSRSYTDIFYKHLALRPSCHKCPFNNLDRPSDITIADFWGWQNTDPGMNADDKGYSLVLVNTQEGRRIWDRCRENGHWRPVDLSTCMQRPLRENAERNPLSDKFREDFTNKGLRYCLRRYGDWNLRSQAGYAYKWIRRKLRKILLGKI